MKPHSKNRLNECLRNEEKAMLKRYEKECREIGTRKMTEQEYKEALIRKEKYLKELEKEKALHKRNRW